MDGFIGTMGIINNNTILPFFVFLVDTHIL